MAMKFWGPLALAAVLGLAGCSDDESAPAGEESVSQEAGAQQQQETGSATTEAEATQGERVARDAEDGDAPQAAGETADVSASAPESDTSQGDVAEIADEPSAIEPPDEGEVLNESEAMPGETSSEDVDAIIEETERRFDEASKKVDEQFKEAEQETPESTVPESEASADLDAALESPSALPDDATTLEEGSSDPEVQAILEETERRFEEASKEIDQQFKQAERRVPDEISGSTTEPDEAP
ncbi:hypothetical protein FZZ93_08190 [Halomonas eurihalina]|uniref:Uncharacterized protein n=1 Tax=Halomonas eurihalina TaxID=42566 RepID=A0A5D9DAQ6_HALER|nr:hypothetical protein [Halomonas eurihalina]MDR5860557.1 hypothetical protein [Halomonas eurihalina]TZG40210.1 hypothetical protein FZZ93_08190 [Halomonas eurihalina]